jgi:hypothetical protein
MTSLFAALVEKFHVLVKSYNVSGWYQNLNQLQIFLVNAYTVNVIFVPSNISLSFIKKVKILMSASQVCIYKTAKLALLLAVHKFVEAQQCGNKSRLCKNV